MSSSITSTLHSSSQLHHQKPKESSWVTGNLSFHSLKWLTHRFPPIPLNHSDNRQFPFPNERKKTSRIFSSGELFSLTLKDTLHILDIAAKVESNKHPIIWQDWKCYFKLTKYQFFIPRSHGTYSCVKFCRRNELLFMHAIVCKILHTLLGKSANRHLLYLSE